MDCSMPGFPVLYHLPELSTEGLNAFKLWCWRRLLRVPWTVRRLNQSILKEINREYSLEELMLKLKLHILATWCEELTHWKRPWCWEKLKAGGKGGNKGWDGWMAALTQWTWVWGNSERQWWTEKPGMLQFMGSQRIGHALASGQRQKQVEILNNRIYKYRFRIKRRDSN